MGLSNSKPNTESVDYKKLRSRHLSKEEIRKNINVLLSNPKFAQMSDTENTLDWITSSMNFNSSQIGGNSLSESENLKKLNNFIKNLDNSEEIEENFDSYKSEIMKLEKYIQQNGGYNKFEGRPLNILYSEYLNNVYKNKFDASTPHLESELNIKKTNKINLSGGNDSENSLTSLNFASENLSKGNLYDDEITSLDKYIKQNGGYDKFEGRLLNIVNSKVLEKITNFDYPETDTENSLSSLGFSQQNGGCPCDSKEQIFVKSSRIQNGGVNTISATSMNSINNRNTMNLSTTSNSSIISRQYGGANTISATSMNSINKRNTMNLSPTSNSSEMLSQHGGANTISATSMNSINIRNTMNLSPTSNSSAISNIQNGGNTKLALNTLSETSLNSKINITNLPKFSETSFSENVLNGGARNERKERRRKNDSSSSSEKESSEDVDLEDSEEDSEESSSEELEINDEDTESSDDTVKMARMIARQRMMSESNNDSSSTTTEEDSDENSSELSSSDETSETSDADTSTESSDSRKMSKMARSKSKKVKSTKTKKSSKGKKSSKKLNRSVTENGLSESTEFRAVPFYSSENSTSFYRNYQNKNRFT
jgi:hypothetical protein